MTESEQAQPTYFISLTRLKLRRFWFLPRFMLVNEQTVRQLSNSIGFISGAELIDKGLTFWTVTVWQNMESMKGFRNKGAHQLAMRKLPQWCSEASYAHWEQPVKELPDWNAMHQKLVSEGRVTKVRRPSPRQLDKSYGPPAWQKSQRVLSPIKK